jgi:hypothetical protein
MFITNRETPDHTAISKFRLRVLPFFRDYFIEFIMTAVEDGFLVNCAEVFVDGTKMKANASRRRARPYKKAGERWRSGPPRSTRSSRGRATTGNTTPGRTGRSGSARSLSSRESST